MYSKDWQNTLNVSAVGQEAAAPGACLVPVRILTFFVTLGRSLPLFGVHPLVFNKG